MKGFDQKKGVDFEKIFSLVVKMSFIQVVFGITAVIDLDIDLHWLTLETGLCYVFRVGK